MTVLDNNSIEIRKNNPTFRGARRSMVNVERKLPINYSAFEILGIHNTIFYDIDFLQAKLERLFEIVSVKEARLDNLSPVEQRLHGNQTAILLRNVREN